MDELSDKLMTKLKDARRLPSNKKRPNSLYPINGSTYLYFILAIYQSKIAIKIGYSVDPDGRRRSIERFNGYPVHILYAEAMDYQQAYSAELSLHKMFFKNRIAHEWFEPTADLLQLIDKKMQSK